MQVRFKKLVDGATVPFKKEPTDAGFDLTAVDYVIDDFGNAEYMTGLAVEIPKGYAGLLFPRSSISRHSLMLANSVGVIDSSYRGEIKLKFKPTKDFQGGKGLLRTMYDIGDRIGQLIIIPYPEIEFVEAEELTETSRGEGGFGSTGR